MSKKTLHHWTQHCSSVPPSSIFTIAITVVVFVTWLVFSLIFFDKKSRGQTKLTVTTDIDKKSRGQTKLTTFSSSLRLSELSWQVSFSYSWPDSFFIRIYGWAARFRPYIRMDWNWQWNDGWQWRWRLLDLLTLSKRERRNPIVSFAPPWLSSILHWMNRPGNATHHSVDDFNGTP